MAAEDESDAFCLFGKLDRRATERAAVGRATPGDEERSTPYL